LRGGWIGLSAALLAALLPLSEAPAHGGGSAQSAAVPAAAAGWGWGWMGPRSADAHFITMMIPHHEGAIAMAELAQTRARRAQIRALAERIRLSQGQENSLMRSWYQQWFGTAVPPWYGPGPGMGMGLPGMQSSLVALRLAPDFDRTFLELMIAHHRMGVMMAAHAQWSTLHPELRALEQSMLQTQSREIEQMQTWYQQWYGGDPGGAARTAPR
jgi:uncharacterized protein (DUF305 family)